MGRVIQLAGAGRKGSQVNPRPSKAPTGQAGPQIGARVQKKGGKGLRCPAYPPAGQYTSGQSLGCLGPPWPSWFKAERPHHNFRCSGA